MLGEEFGVVLREKLTKIDIPPDQKTGDYAFSSVRYEPEGIVELSFAGGCFYAIGSFRDGKKRTLDDKLNDVIVGLLTAIEKNRERREEHRREEERRRLAEEARLTALC